ncbi:MAG: hypothetical protein ACR2RF_04230 [Geminicoccaceae bacterium]
MTSRTIGGGGTSPPYDQRGPEGSEGADLRKIAQLSLICLSLILHSFVLLKVVGTDAGHFDFVFYATVTIVVPVLSAVIFSLGASRVTSLGAYRVDVLSTFSILVMAASIMFAALSVIIWVGEIAGETWQPALMGGLKVLSASHVLVIALASIQSACHRFGIAKPFTADADHDPRALSVAPFTALPVVIITMMMSFQLSGSIPFFGLIHDLFAGLTPPPGLGLHVASVVLALIVVAVAFLLLRYEERLSGDHLLRVRKRALLGTLSAVTVLYFDLRFNSDVLHNLTNAGPANQLIQAGGTPMVDAFSQYGLGPLLMTWLGFLIDRPSLNTVNVVAQVNSLALYCCVLWCMYRVSHRKLAALWIGFFAIAVLLSGWWGGNHSLNSVPSSQGLRFLPCAIVMLAISLIPSDKQSSTFLSASVVLCTLWSFEVLIGGVAIASLYIGLEFVRCRRPTALLRSIALTLALPMALAATLLSSLTFIWSGQPPNILTYLDFALVYNMTSAFWSISASGEFLGWVPIAMVVTTGMALAWLSVLRLGPTIDMISPMTAVRLIAPLAGLTAIMSSYYVGRSVDFTLIIAFLPFCALLIPAFLSTFATAPMAMRGQSLLSLIGCLLMALSVTYSTLAVYRPGGPYITVGGGLIKAITRGDEGELSEAAVRYRNRAMLDYDANPGYYEKDGIAHDALRAIETFAPDRKRLPLLLGQHQTSPWSVHTDMVLLLAKAGHRWPISYVLSDELSKRRQAQILEADVELADGEVVIVRNDEASLGPLEQGILDAIKRRHHLCPQPFSSNFIDIYLVSGGDNCESYAGVPISSR